MSQRCRHSGRLPMAGLGVLLPVLAQAGAGPDAGQLFERNLEPLAEPLLQSPRIESPVPAAPVPNATAVVPVQRLRITGASVFSDATLHALVADAEGRSLTLGELYALVARITAFYRTHGYLLAHAYLPAQEVRDGAVEIAVLEGRLERVEAQDGARLPVRLRQQLAVGLVPGQPLRRTALERAVLLHDEVPGVTAAARLRPGDEPGTTVVVLETQRSRAFAGDISVDNFGDRYTGATEASLRLAWNNPMGRGDQLALQLLGTGERHLYGRAAYDFALAGPLRLTLAASSTRYQLGKEFRYLDADGRADTASVEVRYPLLLRAGLRLDGVLGADAVHLVDRIGVSDSERNKNLAAGHLALNLQGRDRLQGQSVLGLRFTAGRLDIHDPAEAAFDAATVGSEGGFSKFNLSGSRWQPLPLAFQLHLSASLQRALGNLTSAQKLSIGGPAGVRAYPVGEAQGDDAELLALELWHALPGPAPGRLAAQAFVDYGHARLNHRLWSGFSGGNERELAAAGVGLDWQAPTGPGLSASLAWPLTAAPATAEPDRGYRAWIEARWHF